MHFRTPVMIVIG